MYLLAHPELRGWLGAQERRGMLQRAFVQHGASPFAVDVRPHLVDGVGIAAERELPLVLDGEPPASHGGSERNIRPRVANGGAARLVDVVDAADADDSGAELNFQMGWFGRGMDVDETSAGAKPSVGPLQGIDHALRRDSSQGPREQHDVERAVGLGHGRDRARAALDAIA